MEPEAALPGWLVVPDLRCWFRWSALCLGYGKKLKEKLLSAGK